MEENKLRVHVMSEHGEPIDLQSLIRVLNRINKQFNDFLKKEKLYSHNVDRYDEKPYKMVISNVENGSIIFDFEMICTIAGLVTPVVTFVNYLRKRSNGKKSKDSITFSNCQINVFTNSNDAKIKNSLKDTSDEGDN